MGGGWTTNRIALWSVALLILLLEIPRCWSLDSEGLALLEFRNRVDSDPYGAFADWKPKDRDHCMWSGVHCLDGKVNMLDLKGLSLKGSLAPELGNLTHLKSLILSKNQFFGAIPKQLGNLTKLELLDLSENNLNGTIPDEIGELQSLQRLLLSDNNLHGSIPSAIWKLNFLAELQFDENHESAETNCLNRKLGHCIWQGRLKQVKRVESFLSPFRETLTRSFNFFPFFNFAKESLPDNADDHCNNLSCSTKGGLIQPVADIVSPARRKLAEQSSNLAATPVGGAGDHIIALPSSRSSGSFPAVPQNQNEESPPLDTSPRDPQDPDEGDPIDPDEGNPLDSGEGNPPEKKDQPDGDSGSTWKYVVGILCGIFLLFVVVAVIFICRSRAAKSIGPWKTGLSGQLQKAFVTGVPKLNRCELETACEDFSNIIYTTNEYIVYKGTLSSGVEIAVASTVITSLKDWTKRAEMAFRKKIDTLSRVNHKNFTNLIGYCEEDEPFIRMMVFEYAPNGNLYEHLHVKELEHLDWNARMRVIMGTAYCLQYMHDLNPPVAHTNLCSQDIFLTDDYAAKVAEVGFWAEFIPNSKNSGEDDPEHSELPPLADAETNVYSFGLLMLEVISGKVRYSKEQGPLVDWAAPYLNDKRKINSLVDPTLKSFKDIELEIICEAIQENIQSDVRKRPTIKDTISKLREVIDISPEAATPRLSPLWWAELEILSAEAP